MMKMVKGRGIGDTDKMIGTEGHSRVHMGEAGGGA